MYFFILCNAKRGPTLIAAAVSYMPRKEGKHIF